MHRENYASCCGSEYQNILLVLKFLSHKKFHNHEKRYFCKFSHFYFFQQKKKYPDWISLPTTSIVNKDILSMSEKNGSKARWIEHLLSNWFKERREQIWRYLKEVQRLSPKMVICHITIQIVCKPARTYFNFFSTNWSYLKVKPQSSSSSFLPSLYKILSLFYSSYIYHWHTS